MPSNSHQRSIFVPSPMPTHEQRDPMNYLFTIACDRFHSQFDSTNAHRRRICKCCENYSKFPCTKSKSIAINEIFQRTWHLTLTLWRQWKLCSTHRVGFDHSYLPGPLWANNVPWAQNDFLPIFNWPNYAFQSRSIRSIDRATRSFTLCAWPKPYKVSEFAFSLFSVTSANGDTKLLLSRDMPVVICWRIACHHLCQLLVDG